MEEERELVLMRGKMEAELARWQASIMETNNVTVSLSEVTQIQDEQQKRITSTLERYHSELTNARRKIRTLERRLGESAAKIRKLIGRRDVGNGGGDCDWSDADLDGVNPEGIIPAIVWKVVLQHVTETTDLLACSYVCTLWQIIIHRLKPFLPFTASFPHIAKYLPVDSRQHVRLVCKEWKRSIDNMLETYPESYHLHRVSPVEFLDDVEGIDVLFEEMRDHPLANPFPGRYWHIYGRRTGEEGEWLEEPNLPIYWQRALDVLARFGHQLHSVYLSFSVKRDDLLQYFLQVGLGHLPNLRRLKFDHKLLSLGNIPDIILPPLDNLEELNFGPMGITDCPLYNAMLNRYSPQLVKLSIVDSLLLKEDRNLPCLEDLELTLGFATYQIGSHYGIAGKLKLKRISCYIIGIRDLPFLDELIRSSKETLVELDFIFNPFSRAQTSMVPLNCDLPRLEKLKLENYTGTFDILPEILTLRHLTIDACDCSRTGGLAEMVNVVGYEDRMYDSNIWTLLPYLETIEIRNTRRTGSYRFMKYFRGMYEYLKQNEGRV